MHRQLIIRLKTTPNLQGEPQVRWLRLEEAQAEPSIVNLGTLREAAAQAMGCQVVVLVPATEVWVTRTKLPTQSRQKMLKAIPYMLEEQLAKDIEDLHFAVGERAADGTVTVAVVDRARMRYWQQYLADAGLQADVIMPDAMILPCKEHEWAWLREADQSLIRTDKNVGFGVDAANDAAVLELVLRETKEDKPAHMRVVDCRGDTATPPPILSMPDIDIKQESCHGGLLNWLATAGHEFKLAINLLQGDFSKREQWQRILRPWRMPAAFFGIWMAFYLVGALIEAWRYGKQVDVVAAQVETVFKETFPDVKKIVSVRTQMERKLLEMRGGGAQGPGFLSMLTDITPDFQQAGGINFRALRFRPGVLEVELDAPSLQVLDQLKKRLSEGKGMNVEIQAATNKDNKVESRLVIKSK
ncbi:MAG: type II secretion system protein GspL [Pseudomonadota bacterium]